MDDMQCDMKDTEGEGEGGLVGLATELIHLVALSGWLNVGEVAALSESCKRMASILVWDGYGRDLHRALEGVMENVGGRRWRAARYAVGRRWLGEEGVDVWKFVADAVVGGEDEKVALDLEEDLEGWESVLMDALSLPGVSGETETWTSNKSRVFTTSLLHVAADVGSVKVVDWVVERGGDLEVLNFRRASPLWVACENGHLEVVKKLVDAGGDVRVKGPASRTLLRVASRSGRPDVVSYLLGLGRCDVNELDGHGVSSLGAACMCGHGDVVRVLVEEGGADVDVEGKMSRTPMMLACVVGHANVVALLVEKGAWSGVEKGDGEGVWLRGLLNAARKGNAKVVQVLLEAGVPVDGVDWRGNTALLCASRRGEIGVVRVLVEEWGAEVGAGVVEAARKSEWCSDRVVGLLEARYRPPEAERSGA